MAIAWVFPGQGSQKVGMADDVLELSGALDRFNDASQILGRDLLEVCKGINNESNSINDLNDTRNTQPAIFVVESLLVDALRTKGLQPSFVAGHSLGELVALYAAGVFTAKEGLKLICRRSQLMAEAGGGAMAAVIGFDRKQLEGLVEATDGVYVANDNSSSQVVLSGTVEAVQDVTSKLKCKRSIPLQVSGAFHTPLMDKASNSFQKELEKVDFHDALFPVLCNADPQPTSNATSLKNRLKSQMTTGVRWRETMEVLTQQGIADLIEIGPGNVLSGLAKRSLPGVSTRQVSSAIDL